MKSEKVVLQINERPKFNEDYDKLSRTTASPFHLKASTVDLFHSKTTNSLFVFWSCFFDLWFDFISNRLLHWLRLEKWYDECIWWNQLARETYRILQGWVTLKHFQKDSITNTKNQKYGKIDIIFKWSSHSMPWIYSCLLSSFESTGEEFCSRSTTSGALEDDSSQQSAISYAKNSQH